MATRTPLYDRHAAAGARFVSFGGFEMPVWYTGLVEEHTQVREAVGLFDVSHMGEARFKGPEAAAALDRLVSNDMSGMAVGQARYALMCNEQGGVVDDLVVYRLADDDFLVVVNAANRAKDLDWMRAHVSGEVELTDESDDWIQLAWQGPLAEQTLQGITDVDLTAIAYYHHTTGTVAGVPNCLIARTGYTGEDGFEIYAPPAAAEPLWDALLEAGKPVGAVPVGLGARDTLRLEVRFPLYGHELSDEIGVNQSRLMWAVKLDKPGGFIGAAALRARHKGKTDDQFLCGFVVDGKRIPREGCSVLVDGEVVGTVASGTRSPTLGQGIGTAFVRRGLGAPGSRIEIDVRGRTAEATIVKGAFYSRPA